MPVPRRRLAGLAAAAALVLLAGACGDDDDGADDPTLRPDGGAAGVDDGGVDTDSGDSDVCDLISLDELEALFGAAFDPGDAVVDDVTGGEQCTWTNADAPPAQIVSVVHYTDAGLQDAFGQSAAAFFDLNRKALTVDEDVAVGDEAFRSGASVWVRQGDDLYHVLATGDGDEAVTGLKGMAAALVDG